jgi:uncharacterized protein (TIGR00304 family)
MALDGFKLFWFVVVLGWLRFKAVIYFRVSVEKMQVFQVEVLFEFGIVLLIVGVLILVVATILISITQAKRGKTKAAGVVIIGPVPIIFGTDKKSLKTILALSIVLTALLIVAIIVYYILLR